MKLDSKQKPNGGNMHLISGCAGCYGVCIGICSHSCFLACSSSCFASCTEDCGFSSTMNG